MIDIHTHLAFHPLYPDRFLHGMMDEQGLASKLPMEKIRRFVEGVLKDEWGDKMVHQMDAAGVSHSVLLVVDGGFALGEPGWSIEEIFAHYKKVLDRHPGRFSVFSGVDPRRGEAGLELFRRSVEEYGFSGLKLYPPMGYAPDNLALMEPYYSYCETRGLPVLTHTGPSLPFMQNELADPMKMKSVARKFPGVNFILAHAGFRLQHAGVMELAAEPNIFMDLAGIQTIMRNGRTAVLDALRPALYAPAREKILFGTDWPLFNMLEPIGRFIDKLKEIVDELGGPALMEEWFVTNAARLLKTEDVKIDKNIR